MLGVWRIGAWLFGVWHAVACVFGIGFRWCLHLGLDFAFCPLVCGVRVCVWFWFLLFGFRVGFWLNVVCVWFLVFACWLLLFGLPIHRADISEREHNISTVAH